MLDIHEDIGTASRSFSEKLLRFLGAFCPNPCNVDVRVHPDDITSFAELLCSYGERLQVLEIDQFPANIRGELVIACPRMRCKGFVMYSSDIGMLGFALRELEVLCPIEDEMGVEKLTLDMQACPEIEEIEICVLEKTAQEVMEGLLKFEKRKLTTFALEIWDNGIGDKALLEMAKHAKRLPTFAFVRGRLQDLRVLEDIVVAAPFLESVTVSAGDILEWGDMYRDVRVQKLIDIVSIFADCTCLQDVEVSINEQNPVRIEKVANIVRRLRLKNSRRKTGRGIRALIEGVGFFN